ncbi:uncharacterized protein LOC135225548 [Macrobrachium nipponense]|uniref:uncharacterized protein LOC135225548 n=1 Tax=Macrobrachium nipponense TaxID=159736 RepID=UPI0030C833B6
MGIQPSFLACLFILSTLSETGFGTLVHKKGNIVTLSLSRKEEGQSSPRDVVERASGCIKPPTIVDCRDLDILRNAAMQRHPSRDAELENGRRESLLGLVGFMLEKMTGHHFYLVHDRGIDDISDPIIRKMQAYGDVTVFEYDAGLIALRQMISGFYHTGNLRNILVICSSKATLELFRKITEMYLQTPTVHWFVILQDNIATDIAGVIKEGTQITTAVFGKKIQVPVFGFLR